jgi:hypothetical protein
MTDAPDQFKVAELRYANLAGSGAMSLAGERVCAAGAVESEAGTAGAIYRQNNSGAGWYYKITYQWDTVPQPGIYRLIALPYRDQNGNGVYSDAGDIAPDVWENAHAEGRFAAVVLDNQSPSGSADLGLSGEASLSGGVYNYSNTAQNRNLIIGADFSNIADNAGFGIRKIAASQDKPWTMDDPAALSWQYRIVTGGTRNWPATNDAWYPLTDTSKSLDLSAVPGLDANIRRDVQVRFKDSLGNIAAAAEGWIPMAEIVYYTPAYSAVTDWNAIYDDTANTVTVTWTSPPDMSGVEFSVNGGGTQTIDGTGQQTRVIAGVPGINTSGVLSGQSVTGVTEYHITLTAYNAYGKAAPATVKIWNIPGMAVSHDNPAVEIDSAAAFAAIPGTGSSGKTYVLTNDITLMADWTPIGNSSTNAFAGKFYGNGHRITVSGNPVATLFTGVFGYVDGEEIRDLTVDYAAQVNAGTSATRIGGLVGFAGGGTAIRNVLATGSGALTYNGSGVLSTGGITGYLGGGGSHIENCYGGLNLSVTTSASASGSSTGGIAGYINAASLTDCVWTGIITCNFSVDSSVAYVGGIAGSFISTASVSPTPGMRNAAARGNIAAGGGPLYVGGLIRQVYYSSGAARPLIEDSYYAAGTIRVDDRSHGTTITCHIGGLFGIAGDYYAYLPGPEIRNCWSRAAGITVSKLGSSSVDLGGFAGSVYAVAITDSFSESPLALTEAPEARGVHVGGFIADVSHREGITNSIRSCYATAPIDVTGQTLIVGGLIGIASGASTSVTGQNEIRSCYATGTVRTVSTGQYESLIGGLAGTMNFSKLSESWASGSVHAGGNPGHTAMILAGGLAGRAGGGGGGAIENCYALGDVLVDSPYSSEAMYAGGLVGQLSGSVDHSFAAGSVTAQTNSTGPVYAGGLAGIVTVTGRIQNCAALGKTVAVKQQGSSSNKAAGRIYGLLTSGGTISDNYAMQDMYLELWNTYLYGTPATRAKQSSSDAASSDGANAASSLPTSNPLLITESFWTSTMGFTSVWNMSGVARGYPKLANVGEQ